MKPYDWALEDLLTPIGVDPFDDDIDYALVKAYFDGDSRIMRAGDAMRLWEGTPEAQAANVTMIYHDEVDPALWAAGHPFVIVEEALR